MASQLQAASLEKLSETRIHATSTSARDQTLDASEAINHGLA